jgi:hypothetical protein
MVSPIQSHVCRFIGLVVVATSVGVALLRRRRHAGA